jgi:hypothetical protein
MKKIKRRGRGVDEMIRLRRAEFPFVLSCLEASHAKTAKLDRTWAGIA